MAAALAFLVAAGCHSLEVTNPNDPDLARALATGGDVQTLLGGAFNKWYIATTGNLNPGMATSVMADHYESAWGNWGMKLLGWEPRIYQYDNATTTISDIRELVEGPWYGQYGALVSANLVLKALANNVAIPGPTDTSGNAMARAAATFIQGVTLSTIALEFDSGYAFDEAYDATGPALPLVGRDSIQRMALTKFDKAITLMTKPGASWSIPGTFLNQTTGFTNVQLAQVANSWAARTIAYFPHNAAENTAANWAKVLSYASKGISAAPSFDFNVEGDGGTNWYSQYTSYGDEFFVYVRVNYRVVCLFDPAFKCHHSNDDNLDSVPKSPDYRFNGSDKVGDNCISGNVFQAVADPTSHCTTANKQGNADFFDDLSDVDWTTYPPSRGYWRFTHVGHVRYWDYGADSPTAYLGSAPFLLAAENDLLWAEALVRTGGSFATAAGLINKTRVTRGHLPALTGGETLAQMLDAIFYERSIELFASSPLTPWYDQRRSGSLTNPHYPATLSSPDTSTAGWQGRGLQPGTPRLFPVPAKELTLLKHAIYTYGGVGLNPEPPAPVARGVAVRPQGSIFGYAGDGRAILGPGEWVAKADSINAASSRQIRSGLARKM